MASHFFDELSMLLDRLNATFTGAPLLSQWRFQFAVRKISDVMHYNTCAASGGHFCEVGGGGGCSRAIHSTTCAHIVREYDVRVSSGTSNTHMVHEP